MNFTRSVYTWLTLQSREKKEQKKNCRKNSYRHGDNDIKFEEAMMYKMYSYNSSNEVIAK